MAGRLVSRLASLVGRLLFGLAVVGGFLVVILLSLGADKLGWGAAEKAEEAPQIELPPSPVAVQEVRLESIEITDDYAGMIRPLERFSLGFEIAGRVVGLGANDRGEPLDDGDRVTAGQLLARLDDRVLTAQLAEAKAQLEQAQSDMKRARELRSRSAGAITDAQFQQYVTAEALAKAEWAMAEKSLEDTRLVSPVDAVISKREINVGESVSPHQTVMELIQVDPAILVVGVPEAFIGAVREGQPVHVELLARDRFRRKRPKLDGTVRLVAEAADDTTGLFEVEVEIPNAQRRLKPGLIALAHIVVDRREGFRVPLASAVFRGGKTLLYSVSPERTAHAFEVEHWIEQEADMVLAELPPEHRTVVVRGQHRLVEGRTVRVVGSGEENVPLPETSLRTETAGG